jgi:hypothetical protein
MKRRIAAVFSYGFARLLMTLLSAIQIGVWCLLAVPSLFSRKVAELMELSLNGGEAIVEVEVEDPVVN